VPLEYTQELKRCAGYVHFDTGQPRAILFLHGHGEAAAVEGEQPKGPDRLLRHPLPAYFATPAELAASGGWQKGPPRKEVVEQWQQRYELFAPQRAAAGAWTRKELEEIDETILRQRERWHFIGTSRGGAGVLELLALPSARARCRSLALACPKPANVPAALPPVWTRYGGQDLDDVVRFCTKNRRVLNAVEMPDRKHPYVVRNAYDEGNLFEWLQELPK
jgi:hypothetical protein